MKKLILSSIAALAFTVSAQAGVQYQYYDPTYYNWNNTPWGGYGYDNKGGYYNWSYTPSGGYGYDNQGDYYQWYNWMRQ